MTKPTTDQGKWLLAHQGLINIGKWDPSMRGDEIDLRQSILTIEAEARQGYVPASLSPEWHAELSMAEADGAAAERHRAKTHALAGQAQEPCGCDICAG